MTTDIQHRVPSKIAPADKMALEMAGVKFLDKDPVDPLYQNIILPEGWKVETQALWDEKGRRRANIWTGVRLPEIHALPRYTPVFALHRKSAIPFIIDSDCKVLWKGKPVPPIKPYFDEYRNEIADCEEAKKIAEAHLREVLPLWGALQDEAEKERLAASGLGFSITGLVAQAAVLQAFWDEPLVDFMKGNENAVAT